MQLSTIGLLTGLFLLAGVASASQFEPQRRLDEAAANFASDSTKLPALVEAVFSMSHIEGADLNQLPAPAASLLKSKFAMAERAYWAGQHSGVTEQNIAAALNGLSTALALPDYAQTTARQVRKLRLYHMTQWSPGFLGMGVVVHKTAEGATAIPNTMSPLQALHIALTMIDQKFANPEYQRTPAQGEAHAQTGIYHAGNTPAIAEMRDRYREGLAALSDAQALEMLTAALGKVRSAVMQRLICCLAGAVAIYTTLGANSCNSPSKTTTPGGGLRIQTQYNGVPVNGAIFLSQYSGDSTYMQYFSAGRDENSIFTTSAYNSYYNANGYYYNSQKRSPAIWSFTWTNQNTGQLSKCYGAPGNDATGTFLPAAAGVNVANCVVVGSDLEDDPIDPTTVVSIGPSQLNYAAWPPHLVATESASATFSTTYGMPIMQVYDDTGSLIVQTTATSATSNSATFPMPNSSYFGWAKSPGVPYFAVFMNEDGNSDYYIAGNGVFHVYYNGSGSPEISC